VSETSPPAEPSQGEVAASYGLVLALALLLALWGAFLVPLKVGTVPVPVSVLLALVGNAALGWEGGRLYGRLGAAGPGLVWLAVALSLSTQRREGDLVVPGSVMGLLFLLVGAVASAVALGAARRRRA
jgi:hypothetical protein